MRALLERLVRFGLVGALATGVQYAILVVLVRWAGMWPPAASAVGFVVSAVLPVSSPAPDSGDAS